jgi:hypothetical protein
MMNCNHIAMLRDKGYVVVLTRLTFHHARGVPGARDHAETGRTRSSKREVGVGRW